MSASVGFRARLAGMFAARPNGCSPASRRFDGGDGKMMDFPFQKHKYLLGSKFSRPGSLLNQCDIYQTAT
jgi:hypothetical protein